MPVITRSQSKRAATSAVAKVVILHSSLLLETLNSATHTQKIPYEKEIPPLLTKPTHHRYESFKALYSLAQNFVIGHSMTPFNFWTFISTFTKNHNQVTFANIIRNTNNLIDLGTFVNDKIVINANHRITPDRLTWCLVSLSANPNITIQFVKQHHTVSWDWWSLSANPAISSQDVLDNPHLPWDWTALSYNPSITLQHIVTKWSEPWDWTALSIRFPFTLNDLITYKDHPWDWIVIRTCNPYISEDDVRATYDVLPWEATHFH